MQKDLRIKFFLILIIALIPNLALTSETAFHPLASINARTIRTGTLSLGRAPIGNLNSNFLTSSLNFGILERLEVGTAPLFYVIPEHKYNILAKYNFYRGSNIDWAITYGKTVFTTELEISGEKEKPDIEMESSQLVMNLHPTDSKWSY